MQPPQPHNAPAPPAASPSPSPSASASGSGSGSGSAPSVTPPARPRRRVGPVVVALAAGLLVGGGGVGAVWALGDDRSPVPANGAAGDARDACQALAGLDTAKWGRKGAAGDIAFNRYAAAGVLSTAAAAGDATYKPLAEAVRMSQIHHRQSFDFDEKTREKLREARRVCEGLW